MKRRKISAILMAVVMTISMCVSLPATEKEIQFSACFSTRLLNTDFPFMQEDR